MEWLQCVFRLFLAPEILIDEDLLVYEKLFLLRDIDVINIRYIILLQIFTLFRSSRLKYH